MTNAPDRLLGEWLADGPDQGPRPALERALAATRRTPQRPGWTFVQRWLPMDLAMRRAFVPGPLILVLLAALVALALAGALLFVGSRHRPAPPFGPAANGPIILDVDGQLIRMRPDGSDPQPIALGLGAAYSPVFSPDGTRVAFLTGPGPNNPMSAFVANADGGDARNVSGEMNIVGNRLAWGSWSPDSTKIAFATAADQWSRLYVVGADGSGLRAISGTDGDRKYPAWSPDGAWLAYQLTPADPSAGTALAIARPDGSGERVLVTGDRTLSSLAAPQWSPYGSTIAFTVTRFSHDRVGIVGPDRSVRFVSDPDVAGGGWSPDGRSLLAAANSGGGLILDVETSRVRTTIPEGFTECAAMWSPDGTVILGWGTDCRELWRIPVGDPAHPTRISLPDGLINDAAWQRLAP
jgi:Tol biopolymer transport system component